MNVLLIIVLTIIGVIALLFILALFVKKGYAIEREITIDKPRPEVFDYLKHLKNQDHFNKWAMADPNQKKEFRGTDGTVGFVYAWEGNKKVGKGEQEIKSIKEDERIDVEVRFEKPFEAIAYTPFTTESLPGNQTKVKWAMSARMKYPMNIMLLFMNMDKMLGKDIQLSLGNLKTILEKN